MPEREQTTQNGHVWEEAAVSHSDIESNPWLSAPVRIELPPAPVTPPSQVTGPTRPHPGLTGPRRQLPVVQRVETPSLWLLGAHGGAGETTLASLVTSWSPAGHAWPTPAPTTASAWGPPAPTKVVLLARSNAQGLRAAQAAAYQWAANGVPEVDLVGLVVVADAPGRLPKALSQYVDVVAGGVPRLWMLPWVEAWRLGDVPPRSKLSRDVRSVVNDLFAISHPAGDAEPPSRKDVP